MLFWSCCKATTQPQFNQIAARIGELKKKAYDDLMLKDPIHWSKAFFSSRSKCDAVDNNFSEAFNSAILGARFKSVISLFEDIRHYVMHMLVEHKRKSLERAGSALVEDGISQVHEEATTYDFGPSIPATTSASSQPVATSSQPTLVTQLRRSTPKWKITANRTLELVREALDLE
ncbi:hypothetical protein V6N13_075067 [Hibiscus sabdariffa]